MEFPILRDFGFILTAAAAVGLLTRAIRIPLIVAYIFAGLLLGPITELVHPTESLHLISEVGIALLLFLVGLELSIEKIGDVGKVALLAGGGQIALTAILGYGLSVLLGFGGAESVILALGITFSSTVVVVKLLERRGELDATHGRIAVGILLVQDLAVAVTLTLVAGVGATGGGGIGIGAIGESLLKAFAGMGALLVITYLAVRFVLPPLFRWISGSLEALFVWSLTWCFAFILAAEALGLSVEIGAFIAGVGLAQLSYNHELIRRVNPLVNFFLAVFFVTLGIEMELGAALARWPAVLAISAFVLIGKPVILMALIPRFGYGQRTSFLGALTLGQISEFSFILATLALGAGLIQDALLSVIALVGLVTIGISSILIQGGDTVYRRARDSGILRPFGAASQPEAAAGPQLNDHIIVVGMNTLGRRLVHEFDRRGERVLAVDVDARKLAGLPCATLQGNTEHPAVLEEARLSHARFLVSALQIEEANNLLAYRARQAGVPCSIHAFDPDLATRLRDNGATHVMISKYDGIKHVAAALQEAGVVDR